MVRKAAKSIVPVPPVEEEKLVIELENFSKEGLIKLQSIARQELIHRGLAEVNKKFLEYQEAQNAQGMEPSVVAYLVNKLNAEAQRFYPDYRKIEDLMEEILARMLD
jgi:uncharacterized protein YajQ (UPF0234 family)